MCELLEIDATGVRPIGISGSYKIIINELSYVFLNLRISLEKETSTNPGTSLHKT